MNLKVATILKTQALINGVKTVGNKEFVKIIVAAFEGATQEQIERVIENLEKNGNFMYCQITDKDGFIKLFDSSDVGVKAQGVDYVVYKGIDGKYYKDEGGQKFMVSSLPIPVSLSSSHFFHMTLSPLLTSKLKILFKLYSSFLFFLNHVIGFDVNLAL